MSNIWTSREVHFTPFPRTTDEKWEAFFDALPDHYWSGPDLVRRFFEPAISSSCRVLHIAGIPRWMPKWWAMRTVARLAEANGVGGSATFVTERVVLL